MVARMSKRDWNETFFDPDGMSVNVEDSQLLREAMGVPKVQYAPCPNPDAKWKALLAVCTMPGWNGTMKGVMACLIECANYYSGKCCPSEEWIARQLGCDQSSVKRAVKDLNPNTSWFCIAICQPIPSGKPTPTSSAGRHSSIVATMSSPGRTENTGGQLRTNRGAMLHRTGGQK